MFVALAGIMLVSCNKNESQNKAKEVAEKYFESFADRKNYNQMKSFYNDSVQYENVIQNTTVLNLETGYLLNNIYSWNDKSIVYENNKAVTVNNIIANDSVVVVNGEYNKYTYKGFQYSPMRFTTYLYLDKNYKIIKQVDWYNYPLGDLLELYQLEQSKSIKVDQ